MTGRFDFHFEEGGFDEIVHRDSVYRDISASRGTFLLVVALLTGVLGIVCVRVGTLGVAFGAFYRDRAQANASREIDAPAPRAVITDRYGEVLAGNSRSFSVFINVAELAADLDRRFALLTTLSHILSLSIEDLEKLVATADVERGNWVALARGVSATQAISVRDIDDRAVEVVDDYRREYEDAPVFAHVVGYTGASERNRIVGKAGIELQYDDLIRGRDGASVVYRDATGHVIGSKIVSEPEQAPPLALTIDGAFQRYLYQRLVSGLASINRTSGAAVALDPATGEVLALVSVPSFDANAFVDPARSAERSRILSDKRQPLFNRVVAGSYSPGSTIKPLVALAGLHEGVTTPDVAVYSSGSLTIPNPYQPDSPSVFLDWKAHGWVDLADALARSSNIYFYLLGGGLPSSVPFSHVATGPFDTHGLGIERLRAAWEFFGFKDKTGIDLPFEAQSTLPDPIEREKRTGIPWRLGDNYNSAIGQGDLSVNPLQLISFIASVGNQGTIYRPTVKLGQPPQIRREYRDWVDELSLVRSGMADGVSQTYGTSYMLHDLPTTAAGKTGTPQIANKAKVNAFFTGYMPTDNPRIALLVLIEDAREGSLNAVPIAHDALRWYYDHRIAGSESNAHTQP